MKKFINDPDNAVDEMLEGFLHAHRDAVSMLPDQRVIVRTSLAPDKVGIVTGGGSGHKPSFIGYVGSGMLDAVAVGEIFTSPPAATILAAIEAADTGSGVLCLLGNYAGDVDELSARRRHGPRAGTLGRAVDSQRRRWRRVP